MLPAPETRLSRAARIVEVEDDPQCSGVDAESTAVTRGFVQFVVGQDSIPSSEDAIAQCEEIVGGAGPVVVVGPLDTEQDQPLGNPYAVLCARAIEPAWRSESGLYPIGPGSCIAFDDPNAGWLAIDRALLNDVDCNFDDVEQMYVTLVAIDERPTSDFSPELACKLTGPDYNPLPDDVEPKSDPPTIVAVVSDSADGITYRMCGVQAAYSGS